MRTNFMFEQSSNDRKANGYDLFDLYDLFDPFDFLTAGKNSKIQVVYPIAFTFAA